MMRATVFLVAFFASSVAAAQASPQIAPAAEDPNYWTSSPWSLVFLVGCSIVVNIAWRLAERVIAGRLTQRDHAEWCSDVREVLFRLVDAELHRADLLANMAKLIGKQPEGYDEVVQQMFARQLALVPAAAAKAEEMGLFPKGTFVSLGITDHRLPSGYSSSEYQFPSEYQPTFVAESRNSEPPPVKTQWIGNVQVIETAQS